MKKKATLIAAYVRPIRLTIQRTNETLRLYIKRFPGLKHREIRNPLQMMDKIPALTMVKKGFYADIRVRLKASSVFEQASVQEILLKQSDLMKKLMAENEAQLKAEIFKKYQQNQQNSF